MNGNWPVRSVYIRCWVSMILVKTWLESVTNVYISSSSVGGVSGVLVDLMFLLICFMCNFAVAMELGRSFLYPLLGWDMWRSGLS